MAKKPYKYRQARKDAKAAAKKAFPGKVKAVRKDITGKITAEDRLALKDMADTAKKELGKKAYLSRAEYDATRNAELERFRESMREEFGDYGKKMAEKPDASKKPSSKKVAARVSSEIGVKKKAPVKKSAAKKVAAKPAPAVAEAVATKPASTTKKMTRAEKSAANKARWKTMTAAERKNWSATKGTEAKPVVKKAAATPKAAPAVKEPVAKRPTLASLKRNEAKALEEAKTRVEAKKAAAAKTTAKPVKKPTAKKPATTAAKPTVKTGGKNAPKKFAKTRAVGRGGAVLALAGEVVSLAKGSTAKDAREINRLRRKLAGLQGNNAPSGANRFREGAQSAVTQLASLATMGIVGKTRRQRMDELNTLIEKQQKKNTKNLRYGPMGESLVPGTAAYKAGSKTRPSIPKVSTGGSTAKVSTGAGGSTTQASGVYTVKSGDTLSGIAKANKTTLAAIRAANPEIMKKKKYKQGSMIWSGTKVNIPKK